MDKDTNRIRVRPFTRRKKRVFSDYILLGFIYIFIFPFYKFWRFLVWLNDILFFETVKIRERVGYGPGFGSFYGRKFSWGKMSFIVLVIGFAIILFIIL